MDRDGDGATSSGAGGLSGFPGLADLIDVAGLVDVTDLADTTGLSDTTTTDLLRLTGSLSGTDAGDAAGARLSAVLRAWGRDTAALTGLFLEALFFVPSVTTGFTRFPCVQTRPAPVYHCPHVPVRRPPVIRGQSA